MNLALLFENHHFPIQNLARPVMAAELLPVSVVFCDVGCRTRCGFPFIENQRENAYLVEGPAQPGDGGAGSGGGACEN